MCGIAGIINYNGEIPDPAIISRMTCTMDHRGPDADGYFSAPGVALGHRRLAIIDLSVAANQPFFDNSDRYVLIYNGEIYNFREVKKRLTGYRFHTASDTEVIIAAYAAWGDECLNHLNGMFAFAIWDKQEKEIFIARGRMGVKPIYFFADENNYLFASEIRSILASGMVQKKIDAVGLVEYFNYQSLTYPNTMVHGIHEIEAGSWVRIKNGEITRKKYWDLTETPCEFDFRDLTSVQKKIRTLLYESVERRLVSDVPVGVFLSGGIDSSAVVGLMAEVSSSKPDSFNIAFEEPNFDESVYAEIVAKKFNTNHTKILLKPTVFIDELQNALNAMDTPSGDGINTYVVSKAIKAKGITVALSGIGGDELFAGYPVFDQFIQVQKRKWLWDLPLQFQKVMGRLVLGNQPQGRRSRLMQVLGAPDAEIEHMYPIFRQILSPEKINHLIRLHLPDPFITSIEANLYNCQEAMHKLPLLSQVSAAEYLGYTRQTLLKDTDQMSMALSLEVREPFFDHELVKFVLSIPDELKKPHYPKSLLVESLKPLLPEEIVFRKKQGFTFPWPLWLRNELRSFAETHIQHMAERSFIHGGNLIAFWKKFLDGDPNIRWAEIWLFVVLEYWLEKNEVN